LTINLRFPIYAFLIAAVLITAAPPAAQAQAVPAPKMGVVDVQRVLRESKASKSVRPEIDRMRKAFQQQVSAQEQRLRQVEQELTRQRAILAPEAFAQKRRAFSEDARKAQSDVQRRRRELDQAFNNTKNEILKNLVVVARDVAEAKKLNMLVEKRFVFLSAKTMDVTNDIIVRLDKRLPSLKIDLSKVKKGAPKGKK
jgi:outer membrane protein